MRITEVLAQGERQVTSAYGHTADEALQNLLKRGCYPRMGDDIKARLIRQLESVGMASYGWCDYYID